MLALLAATALGDVPPTVYKDTGKTANSTLPLNTVRDCLVTTLRAAPEHFGVLAKLTGPLFSSQYAIIVTVRPGGPLLSNTLMTFHLKFQNAQTNVTAVSSQYMSVDAAGDLFDRATAQCNHSSAK